MAMLEMDVAALSPPQMKRLLEVMRERGQHELATELSAAWTQRHLHPGELRSMTPPQAAELPDAVAPARPPGRRLAATLAVSVAGVAAAGLVWGLNAPGTARSPERPPSPAPVAPAPAAPIAAAPRADVALVTYAPSQTVAPAPAKPAGHNPCYDLPTPGERLICGFPAVAARQKRLQAAYDAAIAAGVRPAALDQSGWTQKANRTWDRAQFMAQMESRIQEIEATTSAVADIP